MLPPSSNIFFLWLLLTLARSVRAKNLGFVYFLHWQDFMRDELSCWPGRECCWLQPPNTSHPGGEPSIWASCTQPKALVKELLLAWAMKITLSVQIHPRLTEPSRDLFSALLATFKIPRGLQITSGVSIPWPNWAQVRLRVWKLLGKRTLF